MPKSFEAHLDDSDYDPTPREQIIARDFFYYGLNQYTHVENQSQIINIIDKKRREQNLTLSGLAERAGMSKSHLSEIFSNQKKLTFENAFRLLLILNIKLALKS